jgi:hypothetical protein
VFWGRNYSSGKRAGVGRAKGQPTERRGEIGSKVIHTTDIILTHGLSNQGAHRIGPGVPNYSKPRPFPGSARPGLLRHRGRCGGSGGVTTAQEPRNINTVAVLRFGRVASGEQAVALGCRGCDKGSVAAFAIALWMGTRWGRREMVDCTFPLEGS